MQTKPESDLNARLDSLEALLDAQTKGIEDGLSRIAGKRDSYAVRRRLVILIQSGRFDEAADEARELPPDAEWADKGIMALSRSGDVARARELLEWAGRLDDITVRDRCLLAYSQGRFEHALSGRPPDSVVLPDSLSALECEGLSDVLDTLSPILKVVEGHGRVLNTLEEQSLLTALNAGFLLGKPELVESSARLLETRKPIPLGLAHFVLSRSIPAADSIPERLLSEHPNSFEAARFAFLIEGLRLSRPREAYEKARSLDLGTLSESQRRRLFETLHSLVHEMAPEEQKEATNYLEALAPRLIGQDRRIFSLFMAERYLASEQPAVAGAILDESFDESDPQWLQLDAIRKFNEGKREAALEQLQRASGLLPDANVFRQTARVASAVGRDEVVIDYLKRVVTLERDDRRSRLNLAIALSRTGQHDEAAHYFHELHRLEPDDPEHSVREAVSLALASRLDDSLKVYEDLCVSADPPLAAVLGRAELLRSMGRPKEAFEGLRAYWERLKDHYQYLLAFMSIGYAAGSDRAASSALPRLLELQSEEKAPSDVLKSMPIEEMKQTFLETAEQHRELREQLLRGQIPWMIAELAQNRVPYFGWSLRTQLVKFDVEERQASGDLTVYSTNGLALLETSDGTRQLVPISCPPRGAPVVADMTTLITLNELGLLDVAASYFGKILVPGRYRERVLHEQSRLVPHQLSQRLAVERIADEIESGLLAVATVDATPCIDEHGTGSDPGSTRLGLLDLITPMLRAGWVTRQQFDEVTRGRSAQSEGAGANATLRCFDRVHVELSTLVTIHEAGLLGDVLGAYQVVLSVGERDELYQALRSFRFLDQVRRSHSMLWAALKSNAAVEFASITSVPTEGDENEIAEDAPPTYAAAAGLLASARRLPLLADDRVLQVMAQNDRPGREPVAFGTDRLIERLEKEGLISKERAADSLLALIRWRYRFIVPSAKTLKVLLNRYRDHPPGQPLREIALYGHRCMSDPGLHGGFEPTEPPTSMASRLHQGWASAVAKLVMLVWADESWSDESAAAVTEWSVRELLPRPPSEVPPGVAGVLSRLTGRFFLSNALLKSTIIDRPERADAALLAVTAALGMDEAEYQRIVADVIGDA